MSDLTIFLVAALLARAVAVEDLVQYVNLLAGTRSKYDLGRGSTLPLIVRPWGATAFAPQTSDPDVNGGGDSRFWFTPEDRRLFGIRCTRQPSPWIADYGNFLITASVPGGSKSHRQNANPTTGYDPSKSTFTPHYFEAEMQAYQSLQGTAKLSLATSTHSAIIKATFPADDDLPHEHYDSTPRIGVVMKSGEGHATTVAEDSEFKTVVIQGYSTANNGGIKNLGSFKNHFVIALYKGKNGDEAVRASDLSTGNENDANYWAWADIRDKEITMRVGTSLISLDQAYLNLRREVGTQTIEQLALESKSAWQEQLARTLIKEVGGAYSDEEALALKRTYYTAAFRSAIFPRNLAEVDADGKEVHWSPYADDFTVYEGPLTADSGFWDAYLTVYPLHSLINRDILGPKVLQGWLNAYKEGGWMPKWASPGHRDSMIGTMSDATFSDAIQKKIPGFDIELAYEAMRKNAFEVPTDANVGRPCLESYVTHGYIPRDVPNSVGGTCDQVLSRSLLYMQADHAISRAAAFLGKEDDASTLFQRSQNYSVLFDPDTGFLRAKGANGKFVEPFDEFAWGGDYTEAGPWQYRFAVTWDPEGLKQTYVKHGYDMSAELVKAQRMPSVFHIGGYDLLIHEMTEMGQLCWGQYAHDNQPSHYMLWMIGASEAESQTNRDVQNYYLRKAMRELYLPTRYPGDEDNGEMAAWYVLAAAGLYHLAPGSTTSYQLGSPLFTQLDIRIDDGKTLHIIAQNNGPRNVFVEKVTFNGEVVKGGSLDYAALVEGGDLVFSMSASSQGVA